MKNCRRSCVWFHTDLPKEFTELIEKDFLNLELENSRLGDNILDERIRKSKNTWIPTTHWSYGFIWSYISRANRENFGYDLTCIDDESMQYTCYNEGEYYHWHRDDNVNAQMRFLSPISSNEGQLIEDYLLSKTEYIRKLSFSLLLSDVDDYEGGNFQILDGKDTHFSPRKKGTLMIFDSRIPHRVLKVTKGQRKSLVGWCIGPPWK